jgi:hypothetical protein
MVIVTSRIRRRTSPSVPFRASGVAAHGAWPRRRGGDCDTDDKHGQQRGSDPAHGLPQEHVRDDELISAGASLTSVEAWLAHRCTPAVALSGHPDCRVSSVLNPQSYETLTPRPDASRRRKSAARVASAGRRGRSDLPDVNPPVVKPLFPGYHAGQAGTPATRSSSTTNPPSRTASGSSRPAPGSCSRHASPAGQGNRHHRPSVVILPPPMPGRPRRQMRSWTRVVPC